MTMFWPNGRLRLMVSSMCNARCPHCHNEGVSQSSLLMSSHVVQLFSDIAREREAPFGTVTFSGGEPLLHPMLADFCRTISSQAECITVPTNGRILTTPHARELALAGVTKFRLDIDPWRLEWNRGRESFFDQVSIEERVNMIRAAGASVALNTVLCGYTEASVSALLEFCERHQLSIKIFERVTFQHSTGRFEPNPEMSFACLADIIRGRYSFANYTEGDNLNGDVSWQGLPFSLRYCRFLCSRGACKLSGLRCAPNGKLSVCMNRFGPEQIDEGETIESAIVKIRKVLNRSCS